MYRGEEGVHLWLSQFGEELEHLDIRVRDVESGGRAHRRSRHRLRHPRRPDICRRGLLELRAGGRPRAPRPRPRQLGGSAAGGWIGQEPRKGLLSRSRPAARREEAKRWVRLAAAAKSRRSSTGISPCSIGTGRPGTASSTSSIISRLRRLGPFRAWSGKSGAREAGAERTSTPSARRTGSGSLPTTPSSATATGSRTRRDARPARASRRHQREHDARGTTPSGTTRRPCASSAGWRPRAAGRRERARRRL